MRANVTVAESLNRLYYSPRLYFMRNSAPLLTTAGLFYLQCNGLEAPVLHKKHRVWTFTRPVIAALSP